MNLEKIQSEFNCIIKVANQEEENKKHRIIDLDLGFLIDQIVTSNYSGNNLYDFMEENFSDWKFYALEDVVDNFEHPFYKACLKEGWLLHEIAYLFNIEILINNITEIRERSREFINGGKNVIK